MKYLITMLVYLLSFVIIGAVTLFIVLVVAGPHAGLLPTWMEVPAVLIGWGIILAVPVFIARNVWLRLNR